MKPPIVFCLFFVLVMMRTVNGFDGNPTTPGTGTGTGTGSESGSTTGTEAATADIIQALGGDFRVIAKRIVKDLLLSGQKTLNISLNAGCKTVCGRVCQINSLDNGNRCPFVCSQRCLRSKRAAEQQTLHSGHLMPMANLFSAYDVNEDGWVNLKELAYSTGQDDKSKDFQAIFKLADLNGDNKLTAQELYTGPFVFEMDLSKNDHAYCQYTEYSMNIWSR